MKTAKALLVILTVTLGLAVQVQAQFNYTVNNGAVTITGYTGPGGAVNIPSTINGLPVASIGSNAFRNCTSLTSVSIPNGVTNLGDYAFYGCSGLTSITIPNNVTSIGNYAFFDCNSLTRVYFQGNAPSVVGSAVFNYNANVTVYYLPGTTGWGAMFGGCLTSLWDPVSQVAYSTNNGTITITGYTGSGGAVTIPSTISGLRVTGIAPAAFRQCSGLASVTIPNSVTSIGEEAFHCTSLTAITVDALNPVYSSADGVLFDKSQTALIQCPERKAGEYAIPNSVVSIGGGAFYYCGGLTSVTIPNSVVSIADGAFYYCGGLTSITIPDSVTSIGGGAFSYCGGLTSVTIPNSVTSIGGGAFGGCTSLTSVTIGNSVTSIQVQAFCGCTGLTSVTIPNSVTSIGVEAFWDCISLTSVAIPNSVTNIGNQAFGDCTSLTGVVIPNNVTSIGDYAFAGCTSLTGVYFKGNAPSVGGSSVFSGSYLIVYYLPGTTGWGPTFGGSQTVLWNPQVQTMGASFGVRTNRFGFTITGTSNLVIVVEACTSLTNPTWSPVDTNTLAGGSSYFVDPQWTNYPRRFYRLCSSVTRPVEFSYTTNNGTITITGYTSPGGPLAIPSTINGLPVTSIGNSAFFNCPRLTSVTIPNSVVSIGNSAFANCDGLTSVTIAASVTSIGNSAFAPCHMLARVYFLGNAPSLGSDVFDWWQYLPFPPWQWQYWDPATIYYLPGTSGWGPTFGGLPTALWHP